MSTPFQDVGRFHAIMGLPFLGSRLPPRFMDPRELQYRLAFLHEELVEFIQAHEAGDLAACADALADLIWVAYGTAHHMRLPIDRVWAEIRRANMEKRRWQEGDPVKARNYTEIEVVKPPGWNPPDVHGVLRDYACDLSDAARE
jgi:predicted HAD superfamily Cof-like phosphohydrolase